MICVRKAATHTPHALLLSFITTWTGGPDSSFPSVDSSKTSSNSMFGISVSGMAVNSVLLNVPPSLSSLCEAMMIPYTVLNILTWSTAQVSCIFQNRRTNFAVFSATGGNSILMTSEFLQPDVAEIDDVTSGANSWSWSNLSLLLEGEARSILIQVCHFCQFSIWRTRI